MGINSRHHRTRQMILGIQLGCKGLRRTAVWHDACLWRDEPRSEVFENEDTLVARRTNNRKVVGSMPASVVCITVLTGDRMG